MADEELKKLRRQRGSVKHKLTNFTNFLKPIRLLYDSKEMISDDTVQELKFRIKHVDSILSEYETVQGQIECICNDDVLEKEYDERDSFFDIFSANLATANAILAHYGNSQDDNANGSTSSMSSSEQLTPPALQIQNAVQNVQGVRLPTINLPKFKGNFDSWLDFRDCFVSLIDNNASISDIQKFHYLKASLEADASKIIQSLEFTSENYKIAWDLLCSRFNNSKLLIHNHIKSIFELEQVTKDSSVALRQLIDGMFKHLRALESLDQPTNHWDALLIFIITTKLDKNSAQEWEKFKLTCDSLRLNDLKTFLNSRAELLETLEVNHGLKTKEQGMVRSGKKHYSLLSTKTKICNYCKQSHLIYSCESFLQLSIPERIKKIIELKLCEICLCTGHSPTKCRGYPCRVCKGKHNVLLHQDKVSNDRQAPETSVVMSSHNEQNAVLLSTAKIYAMDSKGSMIVVRVILDSGSQSNFVSLNLSKKLGLELMSTNVSIIGINSTNTVLNSQCQIKIKSMCNKYSTTLTCIVLPQISGYLPTQKIDCDSWNIPANIHLADPDFDEPAEVDLLIGASHFWEFLKPEKINLGKYLPVLHNTVFGWVISGPIPASSSTSYCNFARTSPVDDLRKFWEIEEVSSMPMPQKDAECERFFSESVTRTDEGRFMVRIPLKYPPSQLGESKNFAVKRMLQLEKRFDSDSALKHEYVKFMDEYIDLGHMSKVTECKETDYFLPHHGVVKKDSLTTKLRVVFNGSSPSTSGWSVNDLQHVGPPIYSNLFSILLQFRQFEIAVCADIEKMYRQILIDPNDRFLQNIVWRFDSDSELCSYTLNTVTYGTASAPYLAIRCLKQLAEDCKDSCPEASKIICHNFYVDDLIVSFPSEKEAISVCTDVSNILESACFHLRKWVSNNSSVTNTFKDEKDPISTITFSGENKIKTLGINWNNTSDTFSYVIPKENLCVRITKRMILSEIAKLFDPIGFLSPCILFVKQIIQDLWKEGLDWDDMIPPHLEKKWILFKKHFPLINNLQIPRHVTCSDPISLELHGFCDSSSYAYGASVYVRSIDSSGRVHVKLLCAKTKVAPIKPMTIPRLELCGALLLARLVKSILHSLSLKFQIYLWSDSQIVLYWIHTCPSLLNVFVANRVLEITTLTDVNCWKYVYTKENPADLASRGVYPDVLLNSQLWWQGPSWLKLDISEWPEQPIEFEKIDAPELKKHCFFSIVLPDFSFPFERFSKLNRLKRVMGYCIRFCSNSRLPKDQRKFGPLSAMELDVSMKKLVKIAQYQDFSKEIITLKKNDTLNSKTKLSSLSLFLDNEELLRVGGRLKYSNLTYDAKYPLLLSGKHTLTRLIFEYTHMALLHAGPQLLLATVRQNYWPTSGMNAAKRVTRSCVTCFKSKPTSTFPFMANLPQERVNVANAFDIVGIDYAGPFSVKDRKGRGYKIYKGYICLFICFASKAIHLELSSDLTTETFLATLRRFVSRRGKPSQIWSDNGTTFVGAQKQLLDVYKVLKQNETELINSCASEAIVWKFIPPHAPHFGGLWESGVKSVKFHLTRILGETKLTFEEFYTLLTQVEATLNSRPLYSLSNDPHDLLPLTPAHLLIGRPLVSLPEVNLRQTPVNRLTRFQFLQSLHQHFWTRWSKEYLSSLQQRSKWKQHTKNVKVGTLVLIRQDNLPPGQWLLGRIEAVHPDSSGVVRVASVRTPKSVVKRAIVKLCPLPIASDEQAETNND